jgi:hypothetical protein
MGGLMTSLEKLVTPLLLLLRKTPAQGAYTSIYAVISDELENVSGKYLIHCEEAIPSKIACDETLGRKLWDISVKLSGLENSI